MLERLEDEGLDLVFESNEPVAKQTPAPARSPTVLGPLGSLPGREPGLSNFQ